MQTYLAFIIITTASALLGWILYWHKCSLLNLATIRAEAMNRDIYKVCEDRDQVIARHKECEEKLYRAQTRLDRIQELVGCSGIPPLTDELQPYHAAAVNGQPLNCTSNCTSRIRTSFHRHG